MSEEFFRNSTRHKGFTAADDQRPLTNMLEAKDILKPNSITLAGSKLVADRFEAKFHYAIWFEAVSKLVADRFELSLIHISEPTRPY